MRRTGNTDQFDEGKAGELIERSCFEVADTLFQKIQTGDLVISFFTGKLIVPDGETPHYNNAVGPLRLISDIFESDVKPFASVLDQIITFTAADYGWKDDFETGLPGNPIA